MMKLNEVKEWICKVFRTGMEMIIKLFTNKDFLTHVSIWVLAIIALWFFKTPGCCKCKCNEHQGKHSEIHVVGTNVVLFADNVITYSYNETMSIFTVTNRVEKP